MSTRNKRIYIICILILTFFTAICFTIMVLTGRFEGLLAISSRFLREADISNAQEEMRTLIEEISANNTYILLEIRITNPITAASRGTFAGCIRGLTELIFSSSQQPLEEIAASYANQFGVEAEERLIEQLEPDETWYRISVNEKSELLVTPIKSLFPLVAPSLATPYPDICEIPGSCYNVGVYYADPSIQVCRP